MSIVSKRQPPAVQVAIHRTEIRRVPEKRGFAIPIQWTSALFLLIAAALILTRAPWWDEAAFADPAYNLAYHGVPGATTWHPAIPGLRDFPQIDRYTYWTPPGYIASLAVWFRVFGFSILTLRAYSTIWGLVVIFVWYRITRILTGSEMAARVAALLIGTDHVIALTAATGRPDMMVTALGSLGLYFYLNWRESSLQRAVLAGASLAALAVLCHPMGLLYVLDLAAMAVTLDRRRIRVRHLGAAVVPFLAAGLAWGLYIMAAPGIFRIQFLGHVGSRASGLHAPLRSVLNDFQYRYLVTYWNVLPGFLRARILVLVAYGVGLLLLISWPWTWRDPKLRLLVLLPVLTYVGMAILDGAKYQNYFVHIFPLFCACLAAAICLRTAPNAAGFRVAAAGLTALVVLQIGGSALRIARNTRGNDYRPVIDFLKSHARPDSRIIGASELMFGLGRSYRLDDDQRLGIYTGAKCDFLVRGIFQKEPEYFAAAEPETAEKMRLKLREFELVFQRGDLRVYVPKAASGRNLE